MNLFKRITAAMMTASIVGTVCYADYELGNLKQFHSFEEYSAVYQQNQNNPDPDGFVYINSSFQGRKGYYVDEDRQSKTFKLNGYNTEVFLKFGTVVDSGMMHLSYDIYQDYDDANPLSKGKTVLLALSRTAGGNFTNGWYHGSVSTSTQYYDQYDPEAINHADDAYQHIIDHGKIIEYGDDADSTPIAKGPLSYYNAARQWGATEAYGPDAVIDWRNWYKVDIYFDKDNNTYEVYLNGELVEGYKYNSATGTYGEALASTLDSSNAYKAIKGVFFRAKTTTRQDLASYPSSWHKRDGGFFLLDNVYVKSYTGDKDIISLVTDDVSGNGIALTGGTVNVAYSEYMDGAVSEGDVQIKNVMTGEEVMDFEISNSDGMQFLITFGDTELTPGQYEIKVSNITGKISGNEVEVPAYFNTVSEGNVWVNNVECLKNDGSVQERGFEITSGTTAVAVEFTDAVNITSETAKDYFVLENEDGEAEIESFEVSEDLKRVTLYPKQLFAPDSEYKLTVLGGLVSQGGTELLTNGNGNIAEEIISVKNDPRCDYSQEFTFDADTNTAKFELDIIKSDTSKIKYTMVVASYKDVEDENGGTVPKLIDIQYVPVSVDEDERILKSFAIEGIDCEGAERVKAFIWDYPSFNNIFVYEETIE